MSIDKLQEAMAESALNKAEGESMSAKDLAKHFGEETVPEDPKIPEFRSKEEAEKWEKDQDESDEVYKIAARVKNLARGSGNLTPVGEMMCNTYVHVLKDLYDFANTLPEPHKTDLRQLLRSHEDMPGNLIAAAKPVGKRR